MEQGQANRGSSKRKLSNSLLVFYGIPWLQDGDEYEPHLKRCVNSISNQETNVKSIIYKTKTDRFVLDGLEKLHQITAKLNDIVNNFMNSKATHLCIVDADIELPPHAVETMIRDNFDIVSGIYYPRGRKDIMSVGYLTSHVAKGLKYNAYRPNDILGKLVVDQKVAASNGCLLIKKRVFQRFSQNIEPLRFRYDEGLRGSDIQFFIDAQRIGYKAMIDGTILCGHLPDTPLSSLQHI